MDDRKPPDPAAGMTEHLKDATDGADLPSDGHISGVDDIKADPASTNTQQLPQTQTGPQGPYQQGFSGHPYSGQPGQGPGQGPPQDSGQHPSVQGHGQTGQQVPSYPYPGQQGQWPGQGQPNYPHPQGSYPHPQQGGQIPYPQTHYDPRFGYYDYRYGGYVNPQCPAPYGQHQYPQPDGSQQQQQLPKLSQHDDETTGQTDQQPAPPRNDQRRQNDPTSIETSQADSPARRDISPGLHPTGSYSVHPPVYPGQQIGHSYPAYPEFLQYPSEPPPPYDGHKGNVLKLEQDQYEMEKKFAIKDAVSAAEPDRTGTDDGGVTDHVGTGDGGNGTNRHGQQTEETIKHDYVSEETPGKARKADQDMSAKGSDTTEITPCYKIEVKGLPVSLSNDSISLYFENRRRSGGGPVVNVINREDGTAVVEFARPGAVEGVLKKTHTISGTCVQVSRFTPALLQSEVSTTYDDAAAVTPDTVRVSGCAGISDDVLEMYFESRKKSGGGDVKCVKREENGSHVALVTFKDPGDAKRVLEKGSHKIHRMDVEVTLYKPKPPTPPPEEGVPFVSPDTIVVTGCKDITTDVLEMFFESRKKSGGGDVKSMERREEDVVLVTFEDPEDVKRVLEKGSHKIQGMDVEVALYKPRPPTPPPVVSPDTIKVTGCGGISDDVLEMYFESRKKSGGGDVKSMERIEEDVVLVTFEDPEDVKRVVEKGSHKIQRKEVDVSRYQPRPPTPPPVVSPDTIVVTGCKDIILDVLEMYFENKKKSGGGDVKSIERIDDVVLVTFENPDDVEAVLLQRSHQIQGVSLQVSQYTLPSRSARHRKLAAAEELYLTAEEDEDEDEEEDDNSAFVILVQGLANTVTNETLTDFFENRRRNGGGEVEIVEIDRDSATALVYFVEGNVVRRVLQKAPLVLEKKKIEVSEYLPSKQPGLVTMDTVLKGKKEGTVVKVEKYGLTSDDTLTMYFENKRRSGGSDVREIIPDVQEHAKYIVFGSKEEAEAVVAKRHHTVDGHKLLVSLYRPPTPPPPRPQYHDRFFITGLREKTTKKTLMKFLKHKLACHPKDLVYGEEPGSVLVNIEVTQGSLKLKKMQRVCRKHPLEGAFLELSAVPVSNCIRVTGITSSTSKDTLQYYFESKRAGNAKALSVEKVNIIEDPRHAIVHFEDHSVIPEILDRTHKLDDMALTVSLYTECLGFGGGHSDPTWFTLPPPITLQNVDSYKLQFIRDSSLNMKNLKQQLKDGCADLKFVSDGSVILECCLTKDMPDARNKVKSWKKNASEDLEHFLSLLITEKVNVLQEVWDHVMKEVEKMKTAKPDAARLYVFDQSQLIVVVGHKLVAEGLSKQVKDVVASVEGDHERKKKEITETMSSLKSWQLRLLLALGFPGDMMKKYEHLKVEINVTKKQIIFIGLVSFVKSAKVDMYETMTDFKQTSLPNVLDAQMMLLQKKDVRDYIVKKLKLKHLVGVWEADKGKLYVYGRTDTEAADVVRVLKQCVVQQVINLDPESVPLLASPDWRRIYDTQTQGRGDTVKIITAVDKSHIVIAAIDELVAGVAEEVNNFITEYTVYSDTVQFPRGIQRFMTTHKDTEITELSEKFKIYSVKIIYQRTSGDFTVKGTKDGLRIVMGELERLSQNVIYGSHLFNKPGIAKLILSDRGEADIKRIEQTERCVIERTYDPHERTVYGNTRKQRGLRTVTGGPQTQATCDLGAGRSLYMCQGDITQMKVGAIVNAANQQLSHGGGLARAIVDKGGRIIQDESDAIIRENGDVNVGKVAVTSSGNLPCQKVIHAVGPIWSGGKNDEEGLLQEAIFSSLEMADSWKLPSIAIPALSTGIYRYPVTAATESIIDAVQMFFTDNPGSKVMDVYVCDNNVNTVQAFIQAVKKVCGAAKVVSVNQGVVAADEDDGQHRFQRRSRRPKSDDAFSREREDAFSSSSIQINIVSGEIATEQVDVIVNSTSHGLDLNNGAVSKSILQRAGMVIQDECSQKYPSGVRPGCFAISSGGMLNCRQIYHTCLPNWTQDANGQQVLQDLIRDCLQEAHKKRYQSIAFPALGTGNLGYPRDVVAKTMMETVEQFGQDNPGTSLQEVKIVVYHKDTATTKAFQYHRQIGSNGAGAHSGAHSEAHSGAHGKATSSSRSRRTFAKGGSSSAEAKTDDHSGSEDYGWEHLSANDLEQVFKIGKVTVTLKPGNITGEKANCIVNSTNSHLNLKQGAVSKSILEAGGNDLEKELILKKSDMKKNGIAVTTAKGLPADYIIHLSSEHFQDWRTAIVQCLKEASKQRLQSIAFPALGTGMLNTKPEDMAKTFVAALDEYQQSTKTIVEDVRIVIFVKTMFEPFFAGVIEAVTARNEGKRGLLQKAMDYLTGGRGGSRHEAGSSGSTPGTVPSAPSDVTLHFFYDDDMHLDRAIQKLENTYRDSVADEVFLDPDLKDLSNAQERELDDLKNKYQIDLDYNRRLGRVRLQGLSSDVVSAIGAVHKLIRGVQRQKQETEKAEIVSSFVQWKYVETDQNGSDVHRDYDKISNQMIEEAYKSKKPTTTLRTTDDTVYVIDFKNMEEYPLKNTSDKTAIIRKDMIQGSSSSFEPPPNWSKTSSDCENVLVDTNSSEYQTLVQSFWNSVGSQRAIIKVERIQTKFLWQQYVAKKQQLDKQNPPGHQNEMILWHGTAPNAIPSICKGGFNRSYCGKNATAHGDGVYFAVNASYSASNTYSVPDHQGYKYMFQARVLTGVTTPGQGGMRVPPIRDPANHINFDAVTGPSMFIIFNDTQAYPEYLITFQ